MSDDATFNRWFEKLVERQERNLTFQEIRKALQALSSVYVQRRDKLKKGAALDTAGKRAAFAVFYGPLHYLFMQAVLQELDSNPGSIKNIVDLGCGTGVGSAAWSLLGGGKATVEGIDLNKWATDECRMTYHAFGLKGQTRTGNLMGAKLPGAGGAVVAAYAINELSDGAREEMLTKLLKAGSNGAKILIVEPIATTPVPWWQGWAEAFEAQGGKSQTWKIPVDLPDHLKLLDKASRMNHQVLKGRTLWLNR
ncbi:MAG: methyltransferase domain-containing protein [Deltaproteobacteria bacterium]|nr:methyltransferase domain-containing protein [Deltaproteobacteria bacterium]MBT6490494.1 methyltransferase domain-containing protein [Deltaproteobacteria bacterium]